MKKTHYELNNLLLNRKDKCYFISHLGLGDNITMSGAVRYLKNFYNKIYVIAKNKNIINLKNFYEDDIDIVVIGIEAINEHKEINKILNNIDDDDDIFVSGNCHKFKFKNKIRNHLLNNYKVDNSSYKFRYNFIVNFYSDINLDFNIYYDYFKLNENQKSIDLYNNVKKYNIVFIHTKSSNKEIQLNLDEYINDDKYLVICANKNTYEKNNFKYNLVDEFVNIPIIEYSSIILNAKVIKVIDSCFSCIILPLIKKLSNTDIEIIER